MTEADFEFEGTEGNESQRPSLVNQGEQQNMNFFEQPQFEQENEGLQVRQQAFRE
jgi:hypothetical protein